MKAKICKVCSLSGIYCDSCEEKVSKGIISSTEIEISKSLYEIEEKFKELKNVSLDIVCEIDEKNVVILITSPISNPLFLATLSKFLSSKIGKNVKVIENTSDMKKLFSQFFAPVRVISITQIWLPGNNYEYSVRISKNDLKKIPADIKKIEHALTNLISSKIRIVSE